MSAADILHVRQKQNYLVTDFVRMERLRDDPQITDILARASREIGFDLVRVHEQTGEKTWTCLLVTTRRNQDGILVDCQGFDYARYSTYVPDKRALDLRDVPVEHYDLKLRQPHEGSER